MKIVACFLLLFVSFLSVKALSQRINIIPQPVEVQERDGSFLFTQKTKIFTTVKDTNVLKVVKLFTQQFKAVSGIQLATAFAASDAANTLLIAIEPNDAIKNKEGYILDITPQKLKINALTPAGVFYALQSIQQLLPVTFSSTKPQLQTEWEVPCSYIIDYPQYPYRGMHLDVSRHFFPASFIKTYIDILASFKINTFHWHLTDSHGWRLEIKQYPKLTSVGAWRADRTGIPMTISEVTHPNEPATYGGFYTQAEVKEIIKYAQLRNIEIIPEIEMPGHCTAALVAYPEYSDLNNKNPLLMPTGYPGDLQHNFCAGYDSTYIFLENILKEVMALFPSQYVHIGGDEVRPQPWMGCPRCQAKMQEKGFTTPKQLQAYFTARIDSFITAGGKKMMGWDEIVGDNIAQTSVNMSWHGDSKAIEAAATNNATVMTPYWYTYFDFYQSDPRLEPDITYAKLQLDTVYNFNPMPKAFTPAQAKLILGGEACLWTENVATPERVEYMLLPRLLALAEAVWTPPSQKSYTGFITRAEQQFKRFDAAGINYAKSLYNVNIAPQFDAVTKSLQVKFTDQTYKYTIHYSLDGTAVSSQSPVYEKEFAIIKSGVLKTALFDSTRQLGKVNIDTFILHKAVGASINIQPNNETVNRLLDGILGTVEPYDWRWVMITDSISIITIDLQKAQLLQSVTARFMEDQVSNIYLPKSILISVSTDGKLFKKLPAITSAKTPQQLLRKVYKYNKPIKQQVRFVKIELRNTNLHPEKDKNIMLLDELILQ